VVSVAKSGKPDEATTQAIASQLIKVSIGLGMPFALYNIIQGKPTVTHNFAGKGAFHRKDYEDARQCVCGCIHLH